MEIITTVGEMKSWSRGQKAEGLKIGFVPTMGFLHEGHLSLVQYCRENCDCLVVSIFVNPKQFGPKEDLKDYPRDLDRDLGLLGPLGVDAVFQPSANEIYPEGYQTGVEVKELTKYLCGAFRPDFFPGVTTVVLKLFNIIGPDLAVFGKKDFQQLTAVKRMVRDLHLDIEIVGGEIVREEDGLAMSSRNTYLSPEERAQAGALYEALQLAVKMARDGEKNSVKILEKVRAHIERRPDAKVQYASLVDVDAMIDLDVIHDRALLALAVIIGKTRLIDNTVIEID